MWAARVWFMLRWIGFDNAALLDGGLRVWKAEGRPCATGSSTPEAKPAGSLSLSPRPEMIADKADMLAAIDDSTTCVIDALSPAVFSGQVQPYARPGHIPGAINVAATSTIDPDTGRFKPADEIRAMLPSRPEARTVAY
jgi:thiosulfate/3-mercaptopyruvate sulfurtransferase